MRKVIGFEGMSEEEKNKMEGEMMVGWPGKGAEGEGGVWILRVGKKRDYPVESPMLGMCVSMRERCELLKRWGARFYADSREVEEFEGVLERRV